MERFRTRIVEKFSIMSCIINIISQVILLIYSIIILNHQITIERNTWDVSLAIVNLLTQIFYWPIQYSYHYIKYKERENERLKRIDRSTMFLLMSIG